MAVNTLTNILDTIVEKLGIVWRNLKALKNLVGTRKTNTLYSNKTVWGAIDYLDGKIAESGSSSSSTGKEVVVTVSTNDPLISIEEGGTTTQKTYQLNSNITQAQINDLWTEVHNINVQE